LGQWDATGFIDRRCSFDSGTRNRWAYHVLVTTKDLGECVDRLASLGMVDPEIRMRRLRGETVYEFRGTVGSRLFTYRLGVIDDLRENQRWRFDYEAKEIERAMQDIFTSLRAEARL
jgi:hypothetical protein